MAILEVTGNTFNVCKFNDNFLTSIDIPYGVAVPANSFKVGIFWSTQDTAQIVADNLDGPWTLAFDVPQTYIPQRLSLQFYNGPATAGSTTVTMTGTGGNFQRKGGYIANYTGAALSSILDGTPVGTVGNGTTDPDPGGITTVGAGIFVGASMSDSAGQTPGAGFREIVDEEIYTGAGTYIHIEDFITSAAQSDLHAKGNTPKAFWTAIAAAFKVGSAPIFLPMMGAGCS